MRRRSPKKTPLLGSHQRSWVWGRHAVSEILDAARYGAGFLMLKNLESIARFPVEYNS